MRRAEISQQERLRETAARAQVAAAKAAEADKRERAESKLRTKISQDIIAERENRIALAALLLALSLLAAGGAAVLLLGAVILFLSRPDFSEIDDRVAAAMTDKKDSLGSAQKRLASAGKYQCTINPQRSRITVSQQDELTLDWTDGGCVNGRHHQTNSVHGRHQGQHRAAINRCRCPSGGMDG